MITKELKPCPFCGNPRPTEEYAGFTDPRYYVKCYDCGAIVHGATNSPEHSAAMWNRRSVTASTIGGRLRHTEECQLSAGNSLADPAGTCADRRLALNDRERAEALSALTEEQREALEAGAFSVEQHKSWTKADKYAAILRALANGGKE